MLQGNNATAMEKGASISLESCVNTLNTSDANSGGYLSQHKYFAFAQNSANGTLDTNICQMPIMQFSMLRRSTSAFTTSLPVAVPVSAAPWGIPWRPMAHVAQEEGALAQVGAFWYKLCKQ